MIIAMFPGGGGGGYSIVQIPNIEDNTTYEYNGEEQGPTLPADLDTKHIEVRTAKQTVPGEYTLILHLRNKKTMLWSDATTDDIPIHYTITPKVVTYTAPTENTFVYSGKAQVPAYSVDETCVDVSNSGDGITAGPYTLTFTLKDTNLYQWDDGKTDPKTWSYTITPYEVSQPSISQTSFTYTGEAQGPELTYDQEHVSVSGDQTAINASDDNYTITFTLLDNLNYQWQGGGTDPIDKTYKIDKAPGTLTLSADSITLNKDKTSDTVTASGYFGTLMAVSDNTDVTAVSISGDVITISSVDNKTGNATVSITASGDTNHAAVTKIVDVECKFVVLIKKKFSEATDEEIVSMVTAANSGLLDLENDCGWAVGQEHQVSLPAISKSGSYGGTSWSVGEDQSAQTVTLVLMDTGANSGYKFSSGKTAHFVVGLKNSMSTYGYMNSSNTNSGSWDGSARRKWCNGGFRQAIESVLPGVFKQFNVVTASSYNGSSNKTSTDYFSLFAAKEIFGGSASSAGSGTGYSNLTEFRALKQIKWYETPSNRIKKLGDNGSAGTWWERSPVCDYSGAFCFVGTDGSAGYTYASNALGLAPFGCL